ncbi:MAG: hypothetical protein J3K34DRAFT_401522 [Monoraphidium minutum]|nr:MAG: hypothetical protein J3K34DRAFT_401522 [Monoraphidium minutum]
MAYRDVHREQKICDLGREVVNAWFTGIKEGPDAARHALQEDVDDLVTYRSNQVLRNHKGQGVDYLCSRIGYKHQQMELVHHDILATAACSQDDTFFALVKYEYRSKVLGDDVNCVGFKIMEMDVLYDETALRVIGIHERNSLAPDDLTPIASLDSAHAAAATPFPEADLTPFPEGLSDDDVLANSRAWCQARTSGQPESVLDRALDPTFRLWDAYGVLPVLCDPARRDAEDACCVKYDQVKDIIRQTKERYDIKCKLIDSAVSLDTNVGFTHWRSRVINKETKQPFEIEAIEVDLFGPDGRLKDIWMFRDPMDMEKKMLEAR